MALTLADVARIAHLARLEIDPAEGSALFRFLHHGMRSVVGTLDDTEIRELVAGADVLGTSGEDVAGESPVGSGVG